MIWLRRNWPIFDDGEEDYKQHFVDSVEVRERNKDNDISNVQRGETRCEQLYKECGMVAEKSTKVIKERAEMNQSPMCYECSILGQRNVGCIAKVGEVENLVWPPSSILGEGE